MKTTKPLAAERGDWVSEGDLSGDAAALTASRNSELAQAIRRALTHSAWVSVAACLVLSALML